MRRRRETGAREVRLAGGLGVESPERSKDLRFTPQMNLEPGTRVENFGPRAIPVVDKYPFLGWVKLLAAYEEAYGLSEVKLEFPKETPVSQVLERLSASRPLF